MRATIMTGRLVSRQGAVCAAVAVLAAASAAAGLRGLAVRGPDRPDAAAAFFAASRHDFGKVSRGERLRYRFRFTNRGAEPLRVERVTTSCGCVASWSTHRVVPPGKSDAIVVELKTHGLRAPARLHKVVGVDFVQGDRPLHVRLAVLANLRPDVTVRPEQLALKRSASGGTDRCELTIRRDMLPVAAFAKLRLAPPAPYYTLNELVRTENELRIAVCLRRDRAPTYPRALEVQYQAHGRREAVRVPVVRLESTEGIAVVPCSYFVSVDRAGSSADLRRRTTRELHLRARDGRDVAIDEISLKKPDEDNPFSWQVVPGAPGTFRVWLDHLPAGKNLAASGLVVSYHQRRAGTHGQVTLNAYVLIGNKGKSRRSQAAASPPPRNVAGIGDPQHAERSPATLWGGVGA